MANPICVAFADAHLSPKIWLSRDIRNDAYNSFSKIVDFSINTGVPMVSAGDMLDSASPDPETVNFLRKQLSRLAAANLKLYLVHGQHDMIHPSWASVVDFHNCVELLHKRMVSIGGKNFYGLDYQTSSTWNKEAADVPDDVDVLILHQTLTDTEFMGALGEVSLAHVLSPKMIIVGDYHKNIEKDIYTLRGHNCRVISPGSTHIRAIDEQPDKYYYVVNDDLTYKRYRIPTRRVVVLDKLTGESDALERLQEFGKSRKTGEKGFSKKTKPIVVLRGRNSKAMARSTKILDQINQLDVHAFFRGMPDEKSAKDAVVNSPSKVRTMDIAITAGEIMEDDDAIGFVCHLFRRGPKSARAMMKATVQSILDNVEIDFKKLSFSDDVSQNEDVEFSNVTIKSVRLHNCFQHEDLSISFGADLNVIVGPNGCGKSNLLTAIYCVLTGDFLVVPGGRTSMVRYQKDKKESSYGEVVLHADDSVILVRRRFDKSSVVIQVDNQPPISKSKEADELLDKVVSGRKEFFNRCFVRQKQFLAWIDLTQTNRLKWLSSLFGLEDCETMHTYLGETLTSARSALSATSLVSQEIIDEHKRNLSRHTKERKSSQDAIDKLEKKLKKGDKKFQEARSKLFRITELEGITSDIDDVEKRTRYSETALTNAKVALQEVESQLARSRKNRDLWMEQLTTYKTELSSLEAQRELFRRQKETREFIEAATSRLAGIDRELQQIHNAQDAPPKLSFDQIQALQEFKVLEKQKTEMLFKIRNTIKSSSRSSDGRVICGSCGQPINEEQVKDLEEWLKENSSTIKWQQDAVDYWASKEELVKELEDERMETANSRRHYKKDLSRMKEQLKFDKLSELKSREKELSKEISTLQESLRGLTNMESSTTSLREKVNSLQREHTVNEERMRTKRDAAEKLAAIMGEVEEVRSIILSHDSNVNEISRLRGVVSNSGREIAHIEQLLRAAENTDKRQPQLKRWIELCSQARDFFDKDNGPRFLMRRQLEQVIEGTYDLLNEIDAGFSASLYEPDMSIMIEKDNGLSHPASSLSGAQQMLLTVALCVSLHLTPRAAGGASTLYLDEPTAYLDKDNRMKMADLTQQLRQMVRKAGAQLVIVSHAAEINDRTDKVIRLGE